MFILDGFSPADFADDRRFFGSSSNLVEKYEIITIL
jgi:hypothetical protein